MNKFNQAALLNRRESIIYLLGNDSGDEGNRGGVHPVTQDGDLAEGLALTLRLLIQQERHPEYIRVPPHSQIRLHLP